MHVLRSRRPALLLIPLILIASILSLPVFALSVFGWRHCARGVLAQASMVPVEGRLLQVEVHKKYGSEVRFAYRFGQAAYVGDTGTFCSAVTTRSDLDPLQAMYTRLQSYVGKPLTVWVDPAHPERAVLYKYTPRAAMVALGFCLPLVAAFMFQLYRYFSRGLHRRFGVPGS